MRQGFAGPSGKSLKVEGPSIEDVPVMDDPVVAGRESDKGRSIHTLRIVCCRMPLG